MSLEQIYDIPGIVETATATVFEAAELVCFTPQGDPALQRERPRVEAICIRTGGGGRYVVINDEASVPPTLYDTREQVFKVRLQLELITESKIATHRSYKCKVMNVMARFAKSVNEVEMPRHRIQFPINDLGESPTYPFEKGMYKTAMNYEFFVAIQQDAWAAIL